MDKIIYEVWRWDGGDGEVLDKVFFDKKDAEKEVEEARAKLPNHHAESTASIRRRVINVVEESRKAQRALPPLTKALLHEGYL